MRGYMDTVSISDLVPAVSTETPVDSTSVYVEASDVKC